MSMNEYVELAFEDIKHEANYTEAILFDFGEPEPVWVPKSQIDMVDFDRGSHVVPVTVWFAKKEGLI